MKKYISIIIVSLLLVSCVGCSNSANSNDVSIPTTNTPTQEVVTVKPTDNLTTTVIDTRKNKEPKDYEEAKEFYKNVSNEQAEKLGFEFEVNGNYVTIKRWRAPEDGSFSSYYAIIPQTINGLQVNRIAQGAFSQTIGRDVTLLKVFIPKTITIIDKGSFLSETFEDVPYIEYYGEALGAPWGAKCMNDSCHYSDCGEMLISKDGKTVITATAKITGGDLVIPEGVEVIAEEAFRDCENITGIVMPSTLKEIKDLAFSGCTGISNIELNDGLEIIGSAAFSNCKNVTSIKIPDSVTEISANAFTGVNHIEYHGSVIPVMNGKFGADYMN